MRYEWGTDGQLLRDDATVGSTEKGFWRERAVVTTGEGTWSFRAQGSRRVLVTGSDGTERVGATRTGWFTPVWEVDAGAAAYVVKQAGPFTSRLVVLAAGVEIGRIVSARWWTDRPALELSELSATAVPLADAVLLLWVGYVVHRRRRSEAATASGAT